MLEPSRYHRVMTEHPQTALNPSLLRSTPLVPLVEALRDGSLSLADHVEAALDRAEQLEPRLRALLPEPGRRERLQADLAALEGRHEALGGAHSLAGALVGVKDIIAVDGLLTRAGSALPAEAFQMQEATAVRRLREAGALILGKTVTTEFAYFAPGATTNPHDPTRTPGGSSSGSAAAVAAGYVPLALGTQTVGSVLRPAAFCGVVGFKPTYGRVPLDGVLAYSPSVDHLGWFTQDVAGARLAASVIIDGWDTSTASVPTTDDPATTPMLAVPDGPYLQQADPEALAVFEETVQQLVGAGFTVRRVPCLEDIEAITARHRWVATAEFGEQHAARFEQYGALYRGMSAELVDAARAITPEQQLEGFDGRAELRERLHRTMDDEGLDAWLMPAATGPAPVGLGATGNPAMNLPWTHAGMPAITVPAGTLEGMPLGLQLASRAGTDEMLLGWAEQISRVLA